VADRVQNSDGERCYPTYTRMEHLGPPQGYPPAYQPYAGGCYSGPVGWAPVVPPQHHYAPSDWQYMPSGAPAYFSDENPSACCIQ
jgi:hypothetical protein